MCVKDKGHQKVKVSLWQHCGMIKGETETHTGLLLISWRIHVPRNSCVCVSAFPLTVPSGCSGTHTHTHTRALTHTHTNTRTHARTHTHKKNLEVALAQRLKQVSHASKIRSGVEQKSDYCISRSIDFMLFKRNLISWVHVMRAPLVNMTKAHKWRLKDSW